MENFDANDLVERYLDGSLSPDEKASVEARMTSDPAFRAEVDLHRQLQEEFVDPQKLQLRDMMSDILRDTPAPPNAPQPNWLKILGMALLVLLGVWAIWRMVFPIQENAPTVPPTQQELQTPTQVPSKGPDSIPQTPPEPIAMADRTAFKSNPVFEARLGNGGIRSTDGKVVEMQSPALGADFKAVKGVVTLYFKGTALSDDDQSENPIQINIYASKSTDTPLAQLLPDISNRNEKTEKWAFSTRKALRLPPGLYYFTIERQIDSDLIFVGKFTVDK